MREEKKESGLDRALEENDDVVKNVQSLAKSLAYLSSSLALGYLTQEKILLKEGWENIFREPEFKETEFVSDFMRFIESVEEEIGGIKVGSGVNIYIGRENPFYGGREFSTMISKYQFPQEEVILALLGPKRMAYDENINFMNHLNKLFEDF